MPRAGPGESPIASRRVRYLTGLGHSPEVCRLPPADAEEPRLWPINDAIRETVVFGTPSESSSLVDPLPAPREC